MYFDTHAHYDGEAFDGDRDAVLKGLPAAGIGLVLNPGCDMASTRKAIEMAEAHAHVFAAAGIHPHEASSLGAGDLDELGRCHPKVMAIGEIGLDYHYDYSPRDTQRDVFRAQMELARALALPVIVHDREAHEDCLAIVREFPAVRGVYHSYSGSLEQAKILVGLGWSLSFTGAVTFKNARRACEVAAWLPGDRIMLETDSPYMTPVPFRGRRNDSTTLPLIAARLAELRGVTTEEIERLTFENGVRFFGIPGAWQSS